MHLVISHTTTYEYTSPVRSGLQELRLHPRDQPGQSVVSWGTTIEGATHELFFDDHYANRVQLVSLDPGVTVTTITAGGEIETTDTSGIVARHLGYTPMWFYTRATELTRPGVGIREICSEIGSGDDLDRLHRLSQVVRERVRYEPGRSHVESTAEDAVHAGSGVCQDHAHVFIAAARTLDLPARYVSGYLLIDASEEQDASHAWAEVWIEGLGWVGFDVSNGISPDERYVRLATGIDYRAAAPVSGVYSGAGDQTLRVQLNVSAGREANQQ